MRVDVVLLEMAVHNLAGCIGLTAAHTRRFPASRFSLALLALDPYYLRRVGVPRLKRYIELANAEGLLLYFKKTKGEGMNIAGKGFGY
jgi:hypothetical protein